MINSALKVSQRIWDHVYFVHPLTDIFVDISTDISLDMSVNISTDMSVDIWSIFRSERGDVEVSI